MPPPEYRVWLPHGSTPENHFRTRESTRTSPKTAQTKSNSDLHTLRFRRASTARYVGCTQRPGISTTPTAPARPKERQRRTIAADAVDNSWTATSSASTAAWTHVGSGSDEWGLLLSPPRATLALSGARSYEANHDEAWGLFLNASDALQLRMVAFVTERHFFDTWASAPLLIKSKHAILFDTGQAAGTSN